MFGCIVLYSTSKRIHSCKTNSGKPSLLQGTIADLNTDVSNEQFEMIVRDPTQYVLPFVLIVILTIGWIADVIVFCFLKKEECKERKMSFDEDVYYPAILISLLGIGTLIGIFVLVNLTRQRQSVSFLNGEPVR